VPLRTYLLWLVVGLAFAGCSGSEVDASSSVTGVVVSVTGQGDVESFVIRDAGGSNRQFTPAVPDEFDVDGLRALVVSQDQVSVVYEQVDDAGYRAVSIEVIE
jgi:hypothetical protein